MVLSGVVLVWLRAALYALVLILVSLHDAWLACHRHARDGLWRLAARYPRCRPAVQAVLRDVSRAHIGTTPRRPTSLGVVLAQQLQDGPGSGGGSSSSDGSRSHLAQLATLINWAEQQGLREVFLYDPRGWLQRRVRLLEKQVDLAGGSNGSNGGEPKAFHVGWPAPAAWQLPTPDLPGTLQQRRKPPQWPANQPGGQHQRQQQSPLQVVLLSAADSHWPLAQAACSAAAAAEALEGEGPCPCPAILSAEAAASSEPPAQCLVHGAGCAAPECPVHGAPLHPAAAARADYSGCQSGLGSAAANGGVPSRGAAAAANGWQAPAGEARALPPWPESSQVAFGSLVDLAAAGMDGGGGGGSDAGSGSRNGESQGGKLEAAIAAPARLRARLEEAVGPLVGAEPDIILVFGEAPTLAGYPPWGARASEIYHVGLLERLGRRDLQSMLQRYLGTKQRFGR